MVVVLEHDGFRLNRNGGGLPLPFGRGLGWGVTLSEPRTAPQTVPVVGFRLVAAGSRIRQRAINGSAPGSIARSPHD